MPGARGALLTRTVAAPTVVQTAALCPACGVLRGQACTSLVAWPGVDQNLLLKPSHEARRGAYTLITGLPAP